MGQEVDTEKKNVWWLIRHWRFHEVDTRSYRIFLWIDENSLDPHLLTETSLITNRDYGRRSHPDRLRSTDILSHGNNHMLNTTCWLVNSTLSHCWNIASFWSIDKLDRAVERSIARFFQPLTNIWPPTASWCKIMSNVVVRQIKSCEVGMGWMRYRIRQIHVSVDSFWHQM